MMTRTSPMYRGALRAVANLCAHTGQLPAGSVAARRTYQRAATAYSRAASLAYTAPGTGTGLHVALATLRAAQAHAGVR